MNPTSSSWICSDSDTNDCEQNYERSRSRPTLWKAGGSGNNNTDNVMIVTATQKLLLLVLF